MSSYPFTQGSNDAAEVRNSYQETAHRRTAENTVKHHDGSVVSVVANHHGGGESSAVVTTLNLITVQLKQMVPSGVSRSTASNFAPLPHRSTASTIQHKMFCRLSSAIPFLSPSLAVLRRLFPTFIRL